MKYLHICDNGNFIVDYIKFIREYFDESNHFFIVIGENKANIKTTSNVSLVDNVIHNYRFIIAKIKTSDKIFLHSLINSHLIYMLFLNQGHLKKAYWVVWGADLYEYYRRRHSLKSYIKHLIRKKVFRNLKGLITQIEGDYELAKLWYGVKGEYYYSFMYPSNLYKEYTFNREVELQNRWKILIGNSADPSNNHFEIIDILQKYKEKNIEIICPLSYGNYDYAMTVREYGISIFGNRFKAVVDYLPFEEYLKLLSDIDIAIFNHKRQQALGNIITLLGLGKKVYIHEDITTWKFCQDHELKVYSIDSDISKLFKEMDYELKKRNIVNVKNRFSNEKLIDDWDEIFRGDV